MGKTHKDQMRQFDIKRHKENAREIFKETDLRTRVKPLQKKKRGGGNNWRNKIEAHVKDEFEDDDEDLELLKHLEEGIL